MKEWAEADNQSKNLPKSERQALNEVSRSLSACSLGLNLTLLSFMWQCSTSFTPRCISSHILPLPAFPVCAANAGGTGRWREAEAGGDPPCQSGGYSQQQPPPGPGELPDGSTV